MTESKLLHRLVIRFFVSSFIFQFAVLDDEPIIADLSVFPLWNTTKYQDVSDSCLLSMDNNRNGVIKFSAHHFHVCGIQLTPSNGTVALIQIPQGVFLYSERQGTIPKCQQRYISITANETCLFMSQHSQLRLFLPGYNRTVLISGIPSNNSIPTCPGQPDYQEQHVSRVIQMKHCKIEEFSHLISCNISSDNTCSFKFLPYCTTILSKRVVEFQCNHIDDVHSNNKALVVIPTNVITLNLTNNSIIALLGNPFKNLPFLQRLILDRNRLTYLNPHVLRDLSNLKYLSLKWNKLSILDSALFKTSSSLKKLSFSGNYLTILPVGIFQCLSNMTELFLDNNRFTSFDNDTFFGLKEMRILTMRKNELRGLPESIFDETVYLKKLDLGMNKLSALHKHLFKNLLDITTLNLDNNDLLLLPKRLFDGLKSLNYLTLKKNQLISLDKSLFQETRMLIFVDISSNNLTFLPQHIFHGLHYFVGFSFYQNRLWSFPYDIFWGIFTLEYIDLGHNEIKSLNSEIFFALKSLLSLYLYQNQLTTLDYYLFQDTVNLRVLDLSGNMLSSIPDISRLNQLQFLNLKDNTLTDISVVTLSSLPKNTELIVSQHEICDCYVSADISCTAGDDKSPFLTCDRLLADRGLVIVMWLIGLNAVGGNIFVLCQRKSKSEKNKVQSFLLSNLAISDLLMGVYMLLIASADIYFGEYFPMRAEAWRSGITCRIAGTISILSSEASVFFVTLISIERYLNIRYPHSRHTLNKKSSIVVVSMLWICSLTLGIVPSSLAGNNDKFYANSHVCIGLPLSKLPKYNTQHLDWIWTCSENDTCYWKQPVETEYFGEVNGMIFSSVVFLGLNFVCYLFILICYVEIVRTVFKSSQRAGLSTEIKEQIRMTAKIAAIVFTDFACWFPIIIIGILVQAGVLTLLPDVFAWCVTFVLPINSAINPYLYTIAGIISSRRKQARIAAAESQQENTNRTVRLRRQMPTSLNMQATGLETISSSGQQSRNYDDNARRTDWLPNMPDVSGNVESNV